MWVVQLATVSATVRALGSAELWGCASWGRPWASELAQPWAGVSAGVSAALSFAVSARVWASAWAWVLLVPLMEHVWSAQTWVTWWEAVSALQWGSASGISKDLESKASKALVLAGLSGA